MSDEKTEYRKQANIMLEEAMKKYSPDYDILWNRAEVIIADLLEQNEVCDCMYCSEHWGLGEYDGNFGDDIKCKCGHVYYRHFDTWDNMRAVGCKYCHCDTFENVS